MKQDNSGSTKPQRVKLAQQLWSQMGTLAAVVRRRRKDVQKKKRYRSFNLQKKLRSERRPLPRVTTLLKESGRFLWQHKRTLGCILLIQAILYFTLIRNPAQANIDQIQSSIETVAGGNQALDATLGTFGVFTSSTTAQQGSIQAVLFILIMSLVYVWAIRQLHNAKAIAARDAYYQGITPMIPVSVILGVVVLQALPFTIVSFLYVMARSNGIFVTGAEDFGFFIVALLIGLLTFYWMTSAVIAMYIASLPGTYPLHALSAAKKLVQFRRLAVFGRIIALPAILSSLYFVLILLTIRFIPAITVLMNDLLGLLILPLVHVYLYKLYRALL